jgi:hypothetical protein
VRQTAIPGVLPVQLELPDELPSHLQAPPKPDACEECESRRPASAAVAGRWLCLRCQRGGRLSPDDRRRVDARRRRKARALP